MSKYQGLIAAHRTLNPGFLFVSVCRGVSLDFSVCVCVGGLSDRLRQSGRQCGFLFVSVCRGGGHWILVCVWGGVSQID